MRAAGGGPVQVELKGKTALVLGLGDTGLSMAKWLARRGAQVRLADTREAPPRLAALRAALPEAQAYCGARRDAAFEGAQVIAISPGVPVADPAVAAARRAGVPVVGDIELFAQAAPGGVIAVTGTNGKSTVTALAGAMARAAGADCEVAGNIGPPVLEVLMRREARPPRLWVLELSSFQLETTFTLAAEAATVLNVSEDHLDRYAGMEEYAAAKARIFHGRGAQVLNRDDPRSLALRGSGRRVLTFGAGAPAGPDEYGLVQRGGATWLAEGTQPLVPLAELPLRGLHNAANALAALALCRALGHEAEPLVGALRAFRGLPHRVQAVGEAGGVTFYDDSKGTNVGAVVAALAGLAPEHPRLVLIAGGQGKGQDFKPLGPALAKAARCAVLIGRDAGLMERAVAGAVPVRRARDMDEAVTCAFDAAQPGDAVLLSPGCASFDMFRDYAHRGEAFRAAVGRLPGAVLR